MWEFLPMFMVVVDWVDEIDVDWGWGWGWDP